MFFVSRQEPGFLIKRDKLEVPVKLSALRRGHSHHNPKANIFPDADFGIVGEYKDIMPELIEHVNDGFTFGIEPKM